MARDKTDKAEIDRFMRVLYKLSFAHEGMDEGSKEDQKLFLVLWKKFIRFVEPDGMYALIVMSKHWSDAEVGMLCMALVRAMHNKKTPDCTGVKVIGRMTVVSAASCCNRDETRLVRNVLTDGGEFSEETSKLEEYLGSMLPKNRSHLATPDGKIIDLDKIFKRVN